MEIVSFVERLEALTDAEVVVDVVVEGLEGSGVSDTCIMV